jgi:hypothetical protein
MICTTWSVRGGGTGEREAGLAWDLQLLVIIRQRIYRGVHLVPSLSIERIGSFRYCLIRPEDVLYARIDSAAVTIIEYNGNSSGLIGRPTTLYSTSVQDADHVTSTSPNATTAPVRSYYLVNRICIFEGASHSARLIREAADRISSR